MTDPLVRVVVVNYRGGDLTIRCLRSVERMEWPTDRRQVVMVDNSAGDGVASRVRQEMPHVKVIDAGTNLGFAGGCNLALADLDGVDYVALLNNDATVEPGWLRPLVDAFQASPSIGAASPKILLAPSFVDVGLEQTGSTAVGERGAAPVRLTGVRVDGHDVFDVAHLTDGFAGLEHDHLDPDGHRCTGDRTTLRVPVPDAGPLPEGGLRLVADEESIVTLTSGPHLVEHRVGAEPAWYSLPLGGQRQRVVNNVGSRLMAGGYGADRGYLEPDRGQYDLTEEVFAWCGAAVLLSRRYLESVGLFDDRFFLYYEDFDLSWRGRAEGWRYLYVPESVVHHVHSASSVVGSRLFAHFNERNRLLTITRNAPLGLVAREAARHLLITASYARRDIVEPLIHGRRPIVEAVYRRLRAFAAYLRLMPSAAADRRRLRARRSVPDRELLEWMEKRGG